MSDYLSNLAARSLEAVATIRPRLPSFYEAPQRGVALPAEPAAEIGAEHTENEAVAATARPRQERAPSPSKRSSVTVDGSDADAAADTIQPRVEPIAVAAPHEARAVLAPDSPTFQPAVDRVEAPAAFTARPVPPVDIKSDAPRQRHGRGEVSARSDEVQLPKVRRATESETSVEVTQPAPIAASIAPQTGQPTTVRRQSEPESPALRAAQRPHAQPESPSPAFRSPEEPARTAFADHEPAGATPRRERDATPEPHLAERVPPPIPTVRRLTPSRIVSDPQPALRVQPVPRSSRMHPRMNPQAPPAPDVHITIGRVEVRAIPAAATPARARSGSASGPMSLDDYLRRRDGRGRR
ncbi:MAG TPA: hypothetical protein VGQ65_10715 [Thermoanaerobaculia bacterium]|jgi:hypothetical protein|nr:hypothetical protein [Thermoanaerobaculia bacterium]